MVEIINITGGACQFEDNGANFVLEKMEKRIVTDDFPLRYKGLVLLTRRIEPEKQIVTTVDITKLPQKEIKNLDPNLMQVEKINKSKPFLRKYKYQFSEDNGKTLISVEEDFSAFCKLHNLSVANINYYFQRCSEDGGETINYKGWFIRRVLNENFAIERAKNLIKKKKIMDIAEKELEKENSINNI